ncbi:URC4/urg3 family protein [Ramlibacter sp. H39-3-26]|uniref:URC4/urg3 family protein n=1 Tax=Curvibacter soli TaxID=3031331 RepID=UPI0023DBCE58|nr:URC4/urg3 family protein [Ramlibacter sp. H39-3-26]MDF1485478.1 URC4/urg3 family protein [Ramlibacter sp. H39-3-26]
MTRAPTAPDPDPVCASAVSAFSADDPAALAATPGDAAALLATTREVRRRAQALLAHARAGQSRWFTVCDTAMPAAVNAVVEATHRRYPGGAIPFHSRWRHFEAGGVDRRAQLDALLGSALPPERARAQIDLAVASVLLDAGAGPQWRYTENATGKTFARSEGLGVASFHAFTAGLFSSDPRNPLRVDAQGLRALDADRLAQALQVRGDNPLVGLEGRATLLRRLGEVLSEDAANFGEEGRPGHIFDELSGTDHHAVPPTAQVQAHDILSTLLQSLGPIWPAQNAIGGAQGATAYLGDCWRHPEARGPGLSDGWMPFHKLSQWLTYSLLEPFEWAGVKVRGLDQLTGLPEYRNGGLFLDARVLEPRDASLPEQRLHAGDEPIVEWRALTVALLDELAPLVRTQLGLSEAQMPLACVLEGGTWAAGRELAQRLRGGTPPLNIESDGTVF